MADYIDRKKLKDKLNTTTILWSIKCKPKVKEKIDSLVEDICKNYLRIIDTAPSIDAVEVVRCKDCKHRYKSSAYEHERCDRLIIPVLDDDFFCKWGEKE